MKKKKRKIPAETRKAERALRIAVAKTIEEHRRTGDPISIWRNGKVVDIPADRLPRS
ncbi:MAG: hypothetical protein WC728_03600 [Elusimicrobiota bacterium]